MLQKKFQPEPGEADRFEATSFINFIIYSGTQMETVKEKLEELTENVSSYAETFYELTMVKLTQQAANAVAAMVNGAVFLLVTILVLLMAGIGLAIWLGEKMNSMAGGFLLVAGFFLLCLLGLILFGRKTIFPHIRNRIVRKMYE